MKDANDNQATASDWDFAAGIAHIVPNFNIEPFGFGTTFGGSNVGNALSAVKLTIAYGDAAPSSKDHNEKDLLNLAPWKGMLSAEKSFQNQTGNWTMNLWRDDGGGPSRFDPKAIEDLLLICHYQVE